MINITNIVKTNIHQQLNCKYYNITDCSSARGLIIRSKKLYHMTKALH